MSGLLFVVSAASGTGKQETRHDIFPDIIKYLLYFRVEHHQTKELIVVCLHLFQNIQSEFK